VARTQIRITKGLADLSQETLRFYGQIGVEEVGLPPRYVTEARSSRPHVPPAQTAPAGRQRPPWRVEELLRMRERAAAFGMEASSISLPLSGDILLGRSGRDADLDVVRECIRAAGAAGLRVLTYGFTALRASEGYYALDGAGRGGASLRAFDYRRVHDLPPLEGVGRHTREEMWERLEYFLRAVVPAAEAAGVILALHPNDPPVGAFRGVAQPVRTLADLHRVLSVVDSPANRLYLDTGVLTEMGEDAAGAIRAFGARGRIGSVHFRNVSVDVPYERYTEVFLDQGDGDPAAWMRAFYESGYDGALDPDHTPGISGDTADAHAGWAFAIGQLIALRNAVTG
jgi:mannonate dehydratase